MVILIPCVLFLHELGFSWILTLHVYLVLLSLIDTGDNINGFWSVWLLGSIQVTVAEDCLSSSGVHTMFALSPSVNPV